MVATYPDTLPVHLYQFPKAKRLDKTGVALLLKNGRRLSNRAFELWAAEPPEGAYSEGSRIAIAVSKRQLASAVARNRIRRIAREVFRAHAVAGIRVDFLLKYRLRSDARDSSGRAQIMDELRRLFANAARIVPRA